MLSALTDSMLRSPDILLFTINLTPCWKISKAARCVNGQLQAAAWKWTRTNIPGSTREFRWKERAVGLCFYYLFSWFQVNTPVFWCYASHLLVLRQILLNSFPNVMNEKGQIAITSAAGVSADSLRTFRGKRLHLFCVDYHLTERSVPALAWLLQVVGPSWQGFKMLGSVNVKTEACVWKWSAGECGQPHCTSCLLL